VTAIALAAPAPLRAPRARVAHEELVPRLNRQSVLKHFDAYADVDWDAPEMQIDVSDPRFERPADHGLGKTAWYRALPQATRARLGLHMALAQLRIGIDFESVLSRGLLELASTHEPGSPELRYAYHEVIEEAQHSLMFQEVIARAGLPVRGLEGLDRWGARRVPALGRTFPELFFLHVLGGEAPIDHAQKLELARRDALHPLFRRVMQIHVTEEARHISFAKSWLRERMPRTSALRMLRLRLHTPFVLAVMARQMIEPPRWLLDLYGVPAAVRREAFHEDPEHRRRLAEGIRPLRDLSVEIGIVTPALVPLWRRLGLWSGSPALLSHGA
jgi:hypothetical protein